MNSNITTSFIRKTDNRIHQGDIYKDIDIIIYSLTENNNQRIEKITLGFGIILSQDCDLNQDFEGRLKKDSIQNNINIDELKSINNKLIPNVLICPAYDSSEVREGIHLLDKRSYKTTDNVSSREVVDTNQIIFNRFNSKQWSDIKINQNSRYHFLESDKNMLDLDLICDFKRYYTVPMDYFYKLNEKEYVCTINELFRERLSQRFSNYLSRIGLPELSID